MWKPKSYHLLFLIALIVGILCLCAVAFGQSGGPLTPYQKAILDLWYFQTNSTIHGSLIEDGTITTGKLGFSVVTQEVDPVFAAFLGSTWIGHTNNSSAHHVRFANSEETDQVFTQWLGTASIVGVETDPIFTNWLDTSSVVLVETDPVFTNWLFTNTYGVYWDDLRFPANSFNPPGIISDPDWVNVWGGLYLLGFDASSDESVFIIVQMPHNWDRSTAIYPHVHTTPGNATSTNKVVWGFEYSWARVGSNYNASTVTTLATNYLDNEAYRHELVSFAPITPDSSQTGFSSCIIGRLYRDADNTNDTYAADDYLIEFDVHYQLDSPGAVTETGGI